MYISPSEFTFSRIWANTGLSPSVLWAIIVCLLVPMLLTLWSRHLVRQERWRLERRRLRRKGVRVHARSKKPVSAPAAASRATPRKEPSRKLAGARLS